MIDDDVVRHVAKLARIRLSDSEVKKFSGQLSAVFGYVEILNEVDTDGITQTSQVTGLKNVMCEDSVKDSQSSREELLVSSELPKDSNQVRVIRIVK